MVGANVLLYMNQSSATVGFALNGMAENTSSQQSLKRPPGLIVTMDCSQAVFLAEDHLIVALRGGDIYSLNIIADGLRGIKNILFEKTAAGVLPSCVSYQGGGACGCGYVTCFVCSYVLWGQTMCSWVPVLATLCCWVTARRFSVKVRDCVCVCVVCVCVCVRACVRACVCVSEQVT